jgi:spore germination protein
MRLREEKITPYQAFSLIGSTMAGVGIITLPRNLADKCEADGMWIVFLGGSIVAVSIWMMTSLGKRFPGKTVAQFAPVLFGGKKRDLLGKGLSIPILAAIALFFLLSAALVARTFGEVMISEVLRNTPIVVIVTSLVLVVGIVSNNPPAILAQFNEVLFPIHFLLIPLLIVTWIQKGNKEHLFPLFHADWSCLWKGFGAETFAFEGYIVILVFMAYYEKPEKAWLSHGSSILFVTLIYFLTFETVLAVFGPRDMLSLMWPTLEVFKAAKLPGLILERLDVAVLVAWVIAVFTTITNCMGALVQLFVSGFQMKERNRKWITMIIGSLIAVLAMLPPDIHTLFAWGDDIGLYGFATSFTISLLLWFVAGIRRMREESKHA